MLEANTAAKDYVQMVCHYCGKLTDPKSKAALKGKLSTCFSCTIKNKRAATRAWTARKKAEKSKQVVK